MLRMGHIAYEIENLVCINVAVMLIPHICKIIIIIIIKQINWPIE